MNMVANLVMRHAACGSCWCIVVLCLAVVPGCRQSDEPSADAVATSTGQEDSGQENSGQATTVDDQIRDQSGSVSEKIVAFLKRGDFDSASDLISQKLIERPGDSEILLLASRVHQAKGDRETALELAQSVGSESAQSVEAVNLTLQLQLELGRPGDAIDELGKAVKRSSVARGQIASWRQQLWALLNRFGRRQEACQQADQMCREGYLNRKLLISLIRRGDSFPLAIGTDTPADFFYPGLGTARWYFSQGEFKKALEHLSKEASAEFQSDAARALYGRLLAESQATDEVNHWYGQTNKETQAFSDYWVALGIVFFDQQRFEASSRALLEAIYIDPTDDDACHRLARVLDALERREDAATIREHAIRNAELKSLAKRLSLDQPQPELTVGLPEMLVDLGRPFEAIGWALLDLPPGNQAKATSLRQQLAFLRSKPETSSMASEVAIAQINRDELEMDDAIQKLAAESQAAADASDDPGGLSGNRLPPQLVEPDLKNVATEKGLVFQWYHAPEIDLKSIPLHEFMGGAIAVGDYDRDGWPDLYMGQGSGEPPLENCTRSNQYFRNIGGRFIDQTESAGAADFHYSVGIAAGDVNQDGFVDLYLGALGDNKLLINNGDGTFHDATTTLGPASPQFTSSVAIADLTGDARPEIFEGVYVEMEGGFRLPEEDESGREVMPGPNDFYAEVDRWYQNLGDGDFKIRSLDREAIEPATALGLIVTDTDADGRNEVFISNDARPNHLLVGFDGSTVSNIAAPSGLAFGWRGFSDSCMGIASGDFNRDGRIDLSITNFSDESNNLFLQGNSGVFTDRARQYQLDALTFPYVGFGTKAIDFNRDGWIDFFISNGHVFDQRSRGGKFAMPPQVILNQESGFVSPPVAGDSDYLQGNYVGRSVAKFDFDRDQDLDLVVGHLDAPYALLESRTIKQGASLQLVLVGTQCERAATGTRVVVTAGGQQFTSWVAAGNGYLCSDETMLDFGLGRVDKIDSIEVNWVSGEQQTFADVSVNQRLLIVQGQQDVWSEIAE
ncbi:ASPIC and UnbV [Planctomycetes bacterium K23_9]|uniref:ASPIC and UnbV n=2 Tax=Stieleria marina TaxID=1930275 RepID=A0A517NT59_9BACT|nr:ASPIC and UnbV [Planctomycetes bacterium K23_9]